VGSGTSTFLTELVRPLRNGSWQISEPTHTVKVEAFLLGQQYYLQFTAQ